MAPLIHLFDANSCQPRCGAKSHSWHWTCDPLSVTCPDCARLSGERSISGDSLAASRPGAARR